LVYYRRGCARKLKLIEFDKKGHRQNTYYAKAYNNEKGYRACLYGEHLFYVYPDIQNIGLVESEKSAGVASMFFPDRIWCATSGTSLNDEKMEYLEGKTVTIYPDADGPGREAAEKWEVKLKKVCTVVIKDLAPDRNDGTDIADLIEEKIKEDVKFDIPALQSLQAKNPLVKDLVERLGLEVVNISKH